MSARESLALPVVRVHASLSPFSERFVPELSDGVYSILAQGVTATDSAFATAYERARNLKRKNNTPAPPPPSSMNVAVVDSGVYSAGDAFFEARMGNSGNAQEGLGFVALTQGRPSTTGQHGSHVASIASSGTTMIRIFDAQVGSTQEGGSVKLSAWTTAFKWALEERARVVNVSIVCPWSEPAISALVNGNSNVLFLATSGNANTEFGADYLRGLGLTEGNVLLVGGCSRDGSREHNRGFGDGIDVYVPSVQVPGRLSMAFAQQQNYERLRKLYREENAKLDKARELVRVTQQKLEADPENARLKSALARDQRFVSSGEAKLPVVPPSAADLVLGPEYQQVADDGVSFGIPMVANVAAKMMLIMPNITAREVIQVMRATARGDCSVGRVLDPSACYAEALRRREQWVGRL